MLKTLVKSVFFCLILLMTSPLKASPGGVSYFSASPSVINQGDSTLLSWGQPRGYSGSVTYNLYVQKPTESTPWLKLENVSFTSFDRPINMLGYHSFFIEACDSAGSCGPRSSVSVFVQTPPPPPPPPPPIPGPVQSFRASSPIIESGQRTLLSWNNPTSYSTGVYYRLSVEKPDGSTKLTFEPYLTSNSFNRLINMVGRHYFYVQACNNIHQCGQESSLSVLVNEKEIAPNSAIPPFTAGYIEVNKSNAITWSAIATANYYKLYEDNSLIYQGSNLTSQISSTTEKTSKYAIAACNNGGCSPLSAEIIVQYYQLPGRVESFGVYASTQAAASAQASVTINHGDYVHLTWKKPKNYSSEVSYNLYVIKPGQERFLWHTALKQLSFTRGQDTGIHLTGEQIVQIEACNRFNKCGELQSISIIVAGPPSKPSLSTDVAEVNYANTVTLNWTKHDKYIEAVTYNLYVQNSSATQKQIILKNTSSLTLDYQLLVPHTNQFFVEACNNIHGCSEFAEVTVKVSAVPNVMNLKAEPQTIFAGSTTQLKWQAPTGNQSYFYNLYVDKPDSSERVQFSTLQNSTVFERRIDMVKTHIFYVQACLKADVCSALERVAVTATGIGKATGFYADKPSIQTGQATRLKWSKPFGFDGQPLYNLYVDKPDGSEQYQFATLITDEFFDRRIDMAGIHTFSIEACNSVNQCGPRQMLQVSAIGIGKVANLGLVKSTFNLNEDIIAQWNVPFNQQDPVFYNLYNKNITTNKETLLQVQYDKQNFTYSIQEEGTFVLEVEACTSLSKCGPRTGVNFEVKDFKPTIGSFKANKNNINQGETITLSWTLTPEYLYPHYFNLYVHKPNMQQDALIQFAQRITSHEIERFINLVGQHTFLVEVCDESGYCSDKKSALSTVSVNVNSPNCQDIPLLKSNVTSLNWCQLTNPNLTHLELQQAICQQSCKVSNPLNWQTVASTLASQPNSYQIKDRTSVFNAYRIRSCAKEHCNNWSNVVFLENRNISIAGLPNLTVKIGQSYQFTPQVDNKSSAPVTFSATGLPSWLTLNTQTGRLTGIPSESDLGTTANIILTASIQNESVSLPEFDLTVVKVSSLEATIKSPLSDMTVIVGNFTVEVASSNSSQTKQVMFKLNEGAWIADVDGAPWKMSFNEAPQGEYKVQVKLIDLNGSESFEEEVTVKLALGVPEIVIDYNKEQASYEINWQPIIGASSYQIEEKLGEGEWRTVATQVETKVIFDTQPAGIYKYRVKACDSKGQCSLSSVVKSVAVDMESGFCLAR